MKFSSIVTAIVSSAIAVSSTPIHKREIGGVLLCTGANATGTCNYSVYALDTCHQLPAPFHHNTSTFAPDGEAFECFPRIGDCGSICTSPTGCTFGAVDFDYAHKFDLGAIQWNTLISSFDCSLKRTATTSS
ncbi:SSCRP protein [Trichoderma parareesei]|uniref:SSCRP protein n=1 Tax=Trichoderma parareesei TaxID=858221 RepID=A0A2H2ZMM7_TRIPA|nr:SSCRP protein [Trichoderma parareesei]